MYKAGVVAVVRIYIAAGVGAALKPFSSMSVYVYTSVKQRVIAVSSTELTQPIQDICEFQTRYINLKVWRQNYQNLPAFFCTMDKF